MSEENNITTIEILIEEETVNLRKLEKSMDLLDENEPSEKEIIIGMKQAIESIKETISVHKEKLREIKLNKLI